MKSEAVSQTADWVALPRYLWPRTGAELASASEKWGARVVLRYRTPSRDSSGTVTKRGGLLAVLVEHHPLSESRLPNPAALPPALQAFLRRAASLAARDWADAARKVGDL
jgi:hypothetical protein